jgi:hypothetical protein
LIIRGIINANFHGFAKYDIPESNLKKGDHKVWTTGSFELDGSSSEEVFNLVVKGKIILI